MNMPLPGFESRSATARGGVAKFFSRKIFVTESRPEHSSIIAGMAKPEDALALGASRSNPVGVQISLPALYNKN